MAGLFMRQFSQTKTSTNSTKSNNGSASANKNDHLNSDGFSSLSTESESIQRFSWGTSAENDHILHAVQTLKKKSLTELGGGVSQTIDDTTFLHIVGSIRSERLSTLPHRGSTWDVALIRALFFVEKLHAFEIAVAEFAPAASQAAKAGYGHSKLLLELGHANSHALEKAFGLFYKCALSITPLLDHAMYLSASPESREQFCLSFTDLLFLVVDVGTRFYKAVHGLTSSSANLDMYEVFGDALETFQSRRMTVSRTIWQHRIDGSEVPKREQCTVDDLVKWLAPQDRVMSLMTDHTTYTDQQAEFTCLWFQDDLVRFIKSADKTLLLNGQPGTGKTTLAGAICERLHRPIARKTYSTVFCTVGIATAQKGSLQIVKSILSQLLDIWVGNISLYHALARAYRAEARTADPKAYEELLWTALGDALNGATEKEMETILVIDGLDEMTGDTRDTQEAETVVEKLAAIIQTSPSTKLICLSQTLAMSANIKAIRQEITLADTRDDLHSITIRSLAASSHFSKHKSGPEQEAIVANIIDASTGSFVWCSLFCELLKAEKTPEAFTKSIQSLANSRTPTTELLVKLVGVLQPSIEARAILTWLVDAARPLTFKELECLIRVGDEHSKIDRKANVHQVVEKIMPLLAVQHDVVRIKHGIVKSNLRLLIEQKKVETPIHDRQIDLLHRTLKYAQTSLTDKGEPSLELLDSSLPLRLFSRNALLEYVIRYWTYHLRQTPYYMTSEKEVKLPVEISGSFPSSTVMPLLEKACWDSQFPGAEEVEHHVVSGNLRRQIFTQDHPAVLQSYINAAEYYEQLEDRPNAQKYYYLVAVISNSILGGLHPITSWSANNFVQAVTITDTKRSENVTQYERMLKILITAYERQYGMKSELVITTKEKLISLYIQIQEKTKAEAITSEINGTVVSSQTNGDSHYNANDLSGVLRIKFGKSNESTSFETHDRNIMDEEIREDDTLLDWRAIFGRLSSAKTESDYLYLWHQASERASMSNALEYHELKVDIINAYAKYLATHKRQSESTAILCSLQQEYENQDIAHSAGMVSRLTQSGTMLRSAGCFAAALSIFKYAQSYYKSTGKTHSHESSQLEEELTVTSREIIKSSDFSAVSDESRDESIFAVLRASIDSNSLSLVRKSILHYTQQRKWTQAAELCRATLKRTWPSFVSLNEKPSLPANFGPECIEIAKLLAESYKKQHHLERVEEVYLRLFRSALTAPQQNKELFDDSKRTILIWYDRRGYPDRSISILQDTLIAYRRDLAPDNALVIALLYDLGHRCRDRARAYPYWAEYYEQIIKAVNKDPKHCHPDVIDAAILVANSYWEERRFTESIPIYAAIWGTYIRDPKSIKQLCEVKLSQQIYYRYYQALESTHAEWEILYKITKEWRVAVRTVFGEKSVIATEATKILAELAEESDKHTAEAIGLYEELSHSSSSSSATQSESIREVLTTLKRRSVHTHDTSKSSSTSASYYQSEFEESKKSYGYAHAATLASLYEACQLLCRSEKSDVATKQLTTAVVEINSKESEETMIESAKTIARTYHACGQTSHGSELTSHLYSQLMTREVSTAATSFDISHASRSLFFLAALEYHLQTKQTRSFSQILTSLKIEHTKFEEFHKTLSTAAPEESLMAAASLRRFLLQHGRKTQIAWVESRALQPFMKKYVNSSQLMSKQSAAIFVSGLLDHLSTRKTESFVWSVILSTNITVRSLVDQKRFPEAHDVAVIGYSYIQSHSGYHGPAAVGKGFELAGLLDGSAGNKCTDDGLRKKLLQFSHRIVTELLESCKKQHINMAQFSLQELNQLVVLLSEQQDYANLELILTILWNTRDAQKNWPSDVLHTLGQRLVCARFFAGHPIKSIRLCEDIAYNLRRVQGIRAKSTLDIYALLAQLYTSNGQIYQKSASSDKAAAGLAAIYFKKAVLVHEDILRWLISDTEKVSSDQDVDGDDDDTAASILAEHGVKVNAEKNKDELSATAKAELVKTHLLLLKYSYQRLGSWPKSYAIYERLNAALFRTFGSQLSGIEGVEKWQAKGFGQGKAQSNDGNFVQVESWEILPGELHLQAVNGDKKL
ncbi:Hypothetical protein R9X50_00766400 [Acrodontium crateriforme]|uniref:AAA+ ATPase domain-containing protein n=1 Tax=Acrodontium crateriforme TaxID=150365 RepID=A0AAQ3RAX3_9PEZI|nr:Hypothetical protein R9X50_00766400 [Acrodontium crateriforme]